MYKRGFVTVFQLQDSNAETYLGKKSLMKELNKVSQNPTKSKCSHKPGVQQVFTESSTNDLTNFFNVWSISEAASNVLSQNTV